MKKKIASNQANSQLKLIKTKSSEILCCHCGSQNYRKNGSTRGRKKYHCKDCKRYFTKETKIHDEHSRGLALGKDVWHAEELGLRINPHKNESKLVFVHIKQDWLKEAAKQYVKYHATTKQLATLIKFLTGINLFSKFISEEQPNLTWENLNRNTILDYLDYLNSKKLKWDTKKNRIISLKQLFETGKINFWFTIPSYLIRSEDYPKKQKRVPRYIPEEIMAQLNQHLDSLPKPVMRMVLVIQETGLRVGELLQLSIDCLKQDSKGDWFIQYMNWKMTKEDTKPISLELAKVIQEQQQYIKYNLPGYSYLFSARNSGGKGGNITFVPKAKVMSLASFTGFLKRLAKEYNISDNLGNVWDFQSHQFRHTVGTRMINSGVPQHIIQRYLGHESPEMTSVYAHIHDQTLKQEIAKYHDSRVVNIAGEIVESTTPELDNNLDLHLLKKKVLAQSLPNGSCARPIVLGECPHANACLTCGDFRTTLEFLDQHKAQLEETEKLVKNAEEKGWKRHAEMNIKIKDNLKKIITSLESGSKDIVSGGDS